MHITVYLSLDLLPSCLFVHEPEDLPVCPECAGRLNSCKPPPTLPPTLIQYPFEEGLESAARDSLHHLGRILSYIFTVPLERVRLIIHQQKTVDEKRIGYTPIELVFDHIEEVSSTIFIVFIFILRFIGVILLIEVVLWRVGVVLSCDPRQICLVTSIHIVDTGINATFDIVNIGIIAR